MSAKSLFFPKDHVETRDFRMADQRERLIYNVTEDLLVLMEDEHVTKAELAQKIKSSKSNVSQLLSGTRNMTLATLSDICFALGVVPKITIPVHHQSANWTGPIAETDATESTAVYDRICRVTA